MDWTVDPIKFLTRDHQERLVRYCEERAIVDLAKGRSRWVRRWAMVDTLLYTGLRLSELVNLHVGDCHLNGRGMLLVRRGKGGKRRTVILERTLTHHLAQYLQWKLNAGEAVAPNDSLFTLSTGKPYSSRAVQCAFKLACKAAGLPAHYSVHSARHTYATNLYNLTKDLRLVQKQLGHSSPSVTAVYADVFPEVVGETLDRLRPQSAATGRSLH